MKANRSSVQRARPRSAARLWAKLAVVASVLVAAVPLVAQPAGATSEGITITHTSPMVAVAGDDLTLVAQFTFTCGDFRYCDSRYEKLVYTDRTGAQQTIGRYFNPTVRTTTADVWTVAIPGTDVGFPSLSYHFESTMTTYNMITGGDQAFPTARYPSAGESSVTVSDTLRLNFIKQDGSAAANVPVRLFGTAAGASWYATTDAQGHLAFTVPPASSWVTSVASGEKQSSLLVYAFDGATPLADASPGAPITVNGNARSVVVQLNFGRPDLPSQPSLQDATVRLHPAHDTVYSISDTTSPSTTSGDPLDTSMCYDQPDGTTYGSRECYNTYDGGTQSTPVGQNLGGGVDMQGRYTYTTNLITTTTHGVSAGYANWVESGGETTAEKVSTAQQTTPFYGPNDTHGFEIDMQWITEEHINCQYKSPTEVNWNKCYREAEFHPYQWGGAVHVDPSSSANYSDTACDPAGGHCNDYTIRVYQTFEASMAADQGRDWGYTVTAGAFGVINLHASNKYSSKSEVKTTVAFQLAPNRTRAAQYLFVPEGALTGETPAHNPDFTYTESSNNLSLGNSVPQDPGAPCITCHSGPISPGQ